MVLNESEIESITGVDSIKEIPSVDTEIDTSNGTYPCKHQGCNRVFDSRGGWLSHQKSHKKEGTITEPAKTSKQDITHIPSDFENLDKLLRQWGVGARSEAVVEAMKYGEINDIQRLRELLIGAGVQANLRESIVGRWAEFQGLKVSPTGTTTQSAPKSSTQELIDTLKEQMELSALTKFASGNDYNKNESSEVAGLKAQVQELKDLLLRQKQEQELASLKEQIKQNKEDNERNVGAIGSSLEKFINEFTHQAELKTQEEKHTKELQQLKEELHIANSKPIQEKMIDKGEVLLNNVAAGIGSIYDKALKNQEGVEKGALASTLLSQGMPPSQVTELLNPHVGVIQRGDSRRVYEQMARATQDVKIPEPQAPEPQETVPESPIKFNTGG